MCLSALSVPAGGYLAGQSMDNQICVFDTHKFCQRSKKAFKGHLAAGFACQLGFSPNGRFLMSGDGEGKLWFWDWKTTKVFKCVPVCRCVPCSACTAVQLGTCVMRVLALRRFVLSTLLAGSSRRTPTGRALVQCGTRSTHHA